MKHNLSLPQMNKKAVEKKSIILNSLENFSFIINHIGHITKKRRKIFQFKFTFAPLRRHLISLDMAAILVIYTNSFAKTSRQPFSFSILKSLVNR